MKEALKQQYDIPLHDIKPIIDVQEYSLYYFLGSLGLGILLISVIVYFLYRWYKKLKAFSLRAEYKKQLDALDISDTKNAAYALSHYGEIFRDDTPQHKEVYIKLSILLQEYKYKKSVANFEDETIVLIDKYRSMI